jgi:hypothetical protein
MVSWRILTISKNEEADQINYSAVHITTTETVKNKINVIDLDGTILRYNSLTRYVVLCMSHWRYFLPILFYSLLRLIRIIPRDVFQKNIVSRMRKIKTYENEMKNFGKKLFHDLDASILRFVSDYTDEFTTNILCTASPEDYVKYLAEMLRWRYLSSTLDMVNDSFYHLYGENKITILKKHYPPHDYQYQLVISDSKSDSGLLKLFQIPYYVKHGTLIQAHIKNSRVTMEEETAI